MRTRVRRLLILAAVIASVCCATGAEAQIYTWRDDAGKLVLSNRPKGSELRTIALPDAAAAVQTTPAPLPRRRQFDDLITEHADRQGVRIDLVRAVVQVESGFNPNARSPKGAVGLMQLMPETARELGVGNPFNPTENIRGGVTYLRGLLDRYGDNEELALAAYNAGPGAVEKYGTRVPPYRETRDYVSRIGQIAGKRVRKPAMTVYKVVEVIDGREVARYTDRKQ